MLMAPAYPCFRADLAVKDGRFAKFSGPVPAAGAKEIDAIGCIVAPGAVDLHNHYDGRLNWDPYTSMSGWFWGYLPDHRPVRLRLRPY